MTRSDHDIVFKLDNTELILWPKWVESIPPQTKVGIVRTTEDGKYKKDPAALFGMNSEWTVAKNDS